MSVESELAKVVGSLAFIEARLARIEGVIKDNALTAARIDVVIDEAEVLLENLAKQGPVGILSAVMKSR